ncbi:MAG: saccharopine dehydrogenase [Rhizobium sp.]|nr:saccharopine dehydrogenase [Rhizobium sp.]
MTRHDSFRVLIIGGYGTFGGRLVELLADQSRLKLIVAGRSLAKAQSLCSRLPAAAVLEPRALDRDGDIDRALTEIAPDILVDATGPFQIYGDDPYRLVKACLKHAIHYLDFADGSAFARDISQFDAEAKARGLFVLSAVSSCPALSGAAIRELARDMAYVEDIEGGIAPSPFAGVGVNVIRAIASYAGQPITLMRDGRKALAYGLTESRRVTVCPPGHLPLKSRRFSLVDVPDLQLVPETRPGLKSIWFGAAPVPVLYLRMLNAMAWLVRLRLLPGLKGLAGLCHFAINRFAWGEHRGGMFVRVTGRGASGERIARSWHLLAEGDAGPYVPSMAIDAVVRNVLAGEAPAPGARAATQELSLDDFARGFMVKSIMTGIRDEPAANQPLYQRILGAAWERLPAPIRSLHMVESTRRFSGRAKVERGYRLFAQLIGMLHRFPKAGAEIPVDVMLERRGTGELWQRTFAGRVFRSWQDQGQGRSDHLIVERFGPVSVGLALVEGEGRLEYVVCRWKFLGIPMPAFMAPGGRTYEFVKDGRFHFHVEIAHPWFGLIVCYQGWLEES